MSKLWDKIKGHFRKAIRLFFRITDSVFSFLLPFCPKKFQKWFNNWKPIHLCWWFKKHDLKVPKYFIGAEDYDFITTCNWTATGTYTMKAYRGGAVDVVTSYSLFYRKKGDNDWIETTNGEVVIASTGEWEIGNDWNKSGNDCLTHSYSGQTGINSCTAVTFNSPGTTVGNYFLYNAWNGCTSLASMPSFTLPAFTTVGSNFLNQTWEDCTSLTSMPTGFNIPTDITTVGDYFLYGAWEDCTSLTTMGTSFNIPTGITGDVGDYFLGYAWKSSALTSMPTGFTIPSGITTVGDGFLYLAWNSCTDLTTMPDDFEIGSGITGTVGNYFLATTWSGCTSLTSMGNSFTIPSGITTVGSNFLNQAWKADTSLTSMPVGFNLPSGLTTIGMLSIAETWYGCTSLASMPVNFDIPGSLTSLGLFGSLVSIWYNCTALKDDGYTEPITFKFTATNAFGGTCPIATDSPAGTQETPVLVQVNRDPPIGWSGTVGGITDPTKVGGLDVEDIKSIGGVE